MNRKIFAAGLTAAALTLSACGGDSTEEVTSGPTTEEVTEEVTEEETTEEATEEVTTDEATEEETTDEPTEDSTDSASEVTTEEAGELVRHTYKAVTIESPSDWESFPAPSPEFVINRASPVGNQSLVLTELGPAGILPGPTEYMEILRSNLGADVTVESGGMGSWGGTTVDVYEVTGADYVAKIYSFEAGDSTYELTLNALDADLLAEMEEYANATQID